MSNAGPFSAMRRNEFDDLDRDPLDLFEWAVSAADPILRHLGLERKPEVTLQGSGGIYGAALDDLRRTATSSRLEPARVSVEYSRPEKNRPANPAGAVPVRSATLAVERSFGRTQLALSLFGQNVPEFDGSWFQVINELDSAASERREFLKQQTWAKAELAKKNEPKPIWKRYWDGKGMVTTIVGGLILAALVYFVAVMWRHF